MPPGQAEGKKQRIKVLILAGSDPVGDWMADIINAQEDMAFLGMVRDLHQALDSVEKLEPDIVLVDVSSGILNQDNLLNRLSAPATGAAVIAVAMMDEVEMVRRAMLHGAQGFLLKPFSEEELLDSVHRTYDLLAERRDALKGVPVLPSGEEEEARPRSEVVAVYSPKGGVGCTTVAVNLAVALRATTNKPVILVDGDLRFGDVDIALNLTSTMNLATVLPNLDTLEDDVLREALVKHGSGIQVLTAPPYVDAADDIEPEELGKLLDRLSYLDEGYVVIDAWSSLDDCTLSFLDACQHLVLVTTPQVTSLRDTHRFLEVLSLLNYEPERTVLVLNHSYHHSNYNLKDVERALGQPITQEIEHAPTQVTTSLNRGIPLVIEYKSSPTAQSILKLARHLAQRNGAQETEAAEAKSPQPAPKAKERKRRGLLFRRQATSRTG